MGFLYFVDTTFFGLEIGVRCLYGTSFLGCYLIDMKWDSR